MAAEPVAKKRKLWRAVAVMFFISCLLTASALLEFLSMGILASLLHSNLLSGVAELP
jgi:hypothetical protein